MARENDEEYLRFAGCYLGGSIALCWAIWRTEPPKMGLDLPFRGI